jgi:hypothetical protein
VPSRDIESRRRQTERDRGSMFVLTIMVSVATVAAVAMVVIPFSVDLINRQRAQTAADAAALAGVHGGQSASAQLATANGATLVAWSKDGRSVTVTVATGEATAIARATDEP